LLLALVQQGDPIQTAKLVASVDQVSNGRFLSGVGGGWKWRITARSSATVIEAKHSRGNSIVG
jgi:alkanesulfonate monooxygenase SsuD/methylene tetrahydromethanopterin reductase-like flavin-dependent oxidoreductase (luciferase family)